MCTVCWSYRSSQAASATEFAYYTRRFDSSQYHTCCTRLRVGLLAYDDLGGRLGQAFEADESDHEAEGDENVYKETADPG
jgi:hypothetical protein